MNLPEGFLLDQDEQQSSQGLNLPQGFILDGEDQELEDTTVLDTANSLLTGPMKLVRDGAQAVFGKEKSDGFQREVADGAALGFADEAEGLIESIFTNKTYEEARDLIRSHKDKFKKENPKTAIAANVIGGATTGGAGLAKTVSAKLGGGALGVIGAGASQGALTGAVIGAGNSDAELVGDDKEVGKFLADTGTGFALGAGFGTLFSTATIGANNLINKFKDNQQVKSMLSDPNLPATINNEADAQKMFQAIDSTADKVLVNGSKVSHPQATEAIKQGFKKGDVFAIRTASDATRKAGLKMVNDYQAMLNNPRVAQNRQVTDTVGEAALMRYNNISQVNSLAGKQVDKASKALTGKNIDVSQEMSNFTSKLEGLGVKVNKSGKNVTIDYKGSGFQDLDKAQKVINNVVNRSLNDGVLDAKQIHNLKKYIDNNVTFGGGKTGAEGQAENIIKGLRSELNKSLKGLSSAYDKANVKYSDTVSVMNDVKSLTGKNGINARTLGLLNNRVDSRAVSSSRVKDIYSSLDEISAKYGVRFKDSVSDLHIFANTIDSTLPNTLNNSLKGQTSKGSSLINSAEQLNNQTMFGTGLQVGKAALDKASGVNTQSQIKALRDLLESNVAFKN